MKLSTEDKKKMREAHKILRDLFPDMGLQVSFNLAPRSSEHYNSMSYNIKISGVG